MRCMSFTPDRKTKATALSVHIVRVVLDSIAGHKPIFIVPLFQRESSLNAFQLLRSLSCSFILAPLRWLNVLLPSGRRLLAYHIGCLNCRIPHVFGCFMLRDVCWLHTPVKIYQRVIFSSRSRLRRVLLLFVVYLLFAICTASTMFPFSDEVDVSNLTWPNMIKGCCFYSLNIFMCWRIGSHAFHLCLSTEEESCLRTRSAWRLDFITRVPLSFHDFNTLVFRFILTFISWVVVLVFVRPIRCEGWCIRCHLFPINIISQFSCSSSWSSWFLREHWYYL